MMNTDQAGGADILYLQTEGGALNPNKLRLACERAISAHQEEKS